MKGSEGAMRRKRSLKKQGLFGCNKKSRVGGEKREKAEKSGFI